MTPQLLYLSSILDRSACRSRPHGLIGASHQYGCTEHELNAAKTDGHLDCMDVRPGAVLIVPVKVPGGGIYLGDAHAVIGEGEIALHGIDITADVTVRVEVIKGLGNDDERTLI
jgi:formamidase